MGLYSALAGSGPAAELYGAAAADGLPDLLSFNPDALLIGGVSSPTAARAVAAVAAQTMLDEVVAASAQQQQRLDLGGAQELQDRLLRVPDFPHPWRG